MGHLLRRAHPTDGRIVSGRTGETIRLGEPEGTPLRASVDGSGDDFYRALAYGSSVVDVTTFDGLTADTHFTTRLRPRGDETFGAAIEAADLTGDGAADLIVNTSGHLPPETNAVLADSGERTVDDGFVVDGRSGELLWSTDPPRLPVEPDHRGSVSPGSPFAWNGTPATGLNTDYFIRNYCSPDDPAIRCEHVLVEVANSPAATRALTITIEDFGPVPEPATDMDLIVFESDELGTVGPFVDQSASWSESPQGEQVTIDVTASSAYFLVRVVYYASVESGYRGSAVLED